MEHDWEILYAILCGQGEEPLESVLPGLWSSKSLGFEGAQGRNWVDKCSGLALNC